MTKQITDFVSKLFKKEEKGLGSTSEMTVSFHNIEHPFTKEFISEQECKDITSLSNQERKKLEKSNKFPRRLNIQMGDVIYGHCYLGDDIRKWHDGKWKVKRVTKRKIKI